MYFPNQKRIQISNNCAEWTKDLTEYQKYCLFYLQEKYTSRFKFGEQGYDNVFVEIDVDDEMLEGLMDKFPYPKRESEGFLDGNNIKIKNRCYYQKEKVDIKTIYMNRNQSKEFFSIFQNLKPKLDQCWIHFENQMTIFEEIPEQNIEKMYYQGDEKQREEQRKLFYNTFNKKYDFGGSKKVEPFLLRRLSVMFGYHEKGKKSPFNIRLVHYRNVLPEIGGGRLRLYFTYFNFENGKLTHELPWIRRKEKKEKEKEEKMKKNGVKQKKTETKEIEPTQEDWDRYYKRKEKIEKRYQERMKELYNF